MSSPCSQLSQLCLCSRPGGPAWSSFCLSFSQSVAQSISQDHTFITVEIFYSLFLLLFYICTGLKAPLQQAFTLSFPTRPAHRWPLWSLCSQWRTEQSLGRKGPEDTANTNYHRQTALTPLGSTSKYCRSGWATDLSHSVKRLMIVPVIYTFFLYIQT